ncbi:MAG: hypothetical protein QM736_04730 [Vicinamibacterales bacterium]
MLIRTRRAGDAWRVRLNNLDPSFRTKRGLPFHVIGISAFSPRAEAGGPIIKDKLFLQQAIQYRYRTNDVPSRPQDEVKKSNRFSSFTRLDANLTSRHSLVGAVGLFPAKATQATLGTFTPPAASVDMKGNVSTFGLTERALWSERLFTETTIEAHSYTTDVMPRGTSPMELLPETTLGNFFNRQHRATSTWQFIESASGTAHGWGGMHLYKAGVDVLNSQVLEPQHEPAGPHSPIGRDAGAQARLLTSADIAADEQHRPRDLRTGSRAAWRPVVRRVRRAPRSRRCARAHEPDAARRCRLPVEQGWQLRTALRLWALLRTDAVGRRRVRSVRSGDRHALRRGRHHADWDAAGPAPRHQRRPPDVAQLHVDHRSRSQVQRAMGIARVGDRSPWTPRAAPEPDGD